MPRPVTPADGIAWVTGASTGIGRAVALKLAKAGWTVAVTARGADALTSLAAEAPEGRIKPFPGDVTDAPGLQALVGRIEADVGPIALALLNAGTYSKISARNFTVEAMDKTMSVNWNGTINALAPALRSCANASADRLRSWRRWPATAVCRPGRPTAAARRPSSR